MEDSKLNDSIVVSLNKRTKGGVGFLACKSGPYLTVSHVVKGSVADETGVIKKGDVILEVNGKSLENVPNLKALEILDQVPIGETLELKIRAQDGYQVRLETAFDEEGVVKTVRSNSPLKSSKNSTMENGKLQNEKVMDEKSNGEPKNPSGERKTTKDTSKCLEVVLENINGEKQENETSRKDKPTLDRTVESHQEITDQDNKRYVLDGSVGVQKCPVSGAYSQYQQPKYIKLENLLTNTFTTDTLHQKTAEVILNVLPLLLSVLKRRIVRNLRWPPLLRKNILNRRKCL